MSNIVKTSASRGQCWPNVIPSKELVVDEANKTEKRLEEILEVVEVIE